MAKTGRLGAASPIVAQSEDLQVLSGMLCHRGPEAACRVQCTERPVHSTQLTLAAMLADTYRWVQAMVEQMARDHALLRTRIQRLGGQAVRPNTTMCSCRHWLAPHRSGCSCCVYLDRLHTPWTCYVTSAAVVHSGQLQLN